MKKKSLTDNIAFEDKCLMFIAFGNIKEAYRLVCVYESEKEFSRGLGIDWEKQAKIGLENTEAEAIKTFLESSRNKYGENNDAIMSALVFMYFMGTGSFNAGTVRLLSRLIPNLEVEKIQRINEIIQNDYFELTDFIRIKKFKAFGYSEKQIKEIMDSYKA